MVRLRAVSTLGGLILLAVGLGLGLAERLPVICPLRRYGIPAPPAG